MRARLFRTSSKHSSNIILFRIPIAVLSCTFSLWLLASFLSFKPDNPSWFYFKTNQLASLWYHYWMTNTAAFFLYLFGSTALMFVPFFLLIAYWTWHQNIANEFDRIIALFFIIILHSFIGAWFNVRLMNYYFVSGGIIGTALVSCMRCFVDSALIAVAITILLCACWIIVTRLSFVQWCLYSNYVMRYLMRVFTFLYTIFSFLGNLLWNAVRFIKECIEGSAVEQARIIPFEYHLLLQELNDYKQNRISSHNVDNVPCADNHVNIRNESSGEEISHRHAESKDCYRVPPINDFFSAHADSPKSSTRYDEQLAIILKQKLERFGIYGDIVAIKSGPVVTLFEYQPNIDSKISKIIALEDDLALALETTSIRIIAPIPGKSVVGFEVANASRRSVLFSTIVRSAEFLECDLELPLILGVDTVGEQVIEDLVTMPHALIAGATGSGKSVALNAMIMSLLCKKTPEELRFILIDPKRLEFSSYHDIPHLLFPVVTNAREAIPILKWLVLEMERRYEVLAALGVRNSNDYRKLTRTTNSLEPMPYIVMIIDELADLMILGGKEVELHITRLAQMARAAGIHLIVATQRPSVDVITGTIKVNFPTRIALRVVSKVDSRTILDYCGAEKLLGKGDMLFNDSTHCMKRIHSSLVTDKEITALSDYCRTSAKVQYELLQHDLLENQDIPFADQELYQQVLDYIKTVDEISISLLQRKFRIGYNRSARIIELLESQGLILSSDGGKTRKVIH